MKLTVIGAGGVRSMFLAKSIAQRARELALAVGPFWQRHAERHVGAAAVDRVDQSVIARRAEITQHDIVTDAAVARRVQSARLIIGAVEIVGERDFVRRIPDVARLRAAGPFSFRPGCPRIQKAFRGRP